jgi:protein SCO1/2
MGVSLNPLVPAQHTSRLRRASAGLAIVLAVAACGSSSDGPTALSGVVRDPLPAVDGIALPSLTTPGDMVQFRAGSGNLQVVYFGFTNCPDVCPTTLADFAVALRKLPSEQADKIDVVMVTVDPDRDLELLDNYITSFIDGGIAAGTDDESDLLTAAEPFGASWDVRTLDDGSVEVDHSAFLYVVDAAGQLVLTWQFGATSDDMANDLTVLFERYLA